MSDRKSFTHKDYSTIIFQKFDGRFVLIKEAHNELYYL